MPSNQMLRSALFRSAVALAIGAICLFAVGAPDVALALDEHSSSLETQALGVDSEELPARQLREALVLEDREGYNSEYMFGMTRAIVNSTLHPAVKPLAFIVTVPLDLAFLPFAAIGGLF